MDSKPETKSIGLTKAAQDMIGSRLLEMGYRIVDITFDAETGKPDVSEDVVDCIYFSPDFFGYFLSGNREERQIIGRDVIVPKARSWIHVPSAGLDAWYSILENMKLRTSDEDNSEGVKLTHAPGVSGAAMAEYVVAHMLSIAKKIPEHAAIQKERKWQKISQKAMDRATLGILGCGGIGLQTARLLKSFGTRVIGTKRSIKTHFVSKNAFQNGTAQAPSPAGAPTQTENDSIVDEWFPSDDASTIEVLRQSDYVLCCLPLTPQTRECITLRHFEAMGSETWFINVSRGDVIDQDVMMQALNSEIIAGAVLDVTTPEPLPEDSPLWTTKNCIITAHDSWNSPQSFERITANFLENAERFINDECLIAEVSHIYNAESKNKIIMM